MQNDEILDDLHIRILRVTEDLRASHTGNQDACVEIGPVQCWPAGLESYSHSEDARRIVKLKGTRIDLGRGLPGEPGDGHADGGENEHPEDRTFR